MAKATILLLPGAWFPTLTYEPLLDSLKKAGYSVLTSTYPSLDPIGDPSKLTCSTDSDYLREEYIEPLIEKEGKNLVLLMHSYSGMPGAAAAFGYSKRERQAQNLKGGIVGLIMVSAFVVNEGLSCAGSMGGQLPPWIRQDNPRIGLCTPQDPGQMFAGDVGPEVAMPVMRKLVNHATVAFLSPQPPPAFAEPSMNGLIAYIMLLKDMAVPIVGQEAMIQYSGQQWEVRKLDMCHNTPFISKVTEIVNVIDELTSVFEQRLNT